MAKMIQGLSEAALHVRDLQRAKTFYTDVLGFRVRLETPRLVALDAGRDTVLLLFLEGETGLDLVDENGTIPGHGGSGRLHVAFGIEPAAQTFWKSRLAECGVALTGEYAWPLGGSSIYFTDPDGHVIELATPGIWPELDCADKTSDSLE